MGEAPHLFALGGICSLVDLVSPVGYFILLMDCIFALFCGGGGINFPGIIWLMEKVCKTFSFLVE